MRSGRFASRSLRILLLGSGILLLQQVSIPYGFTFGSFAAPHASLVHLHTGLLLAIAMLERDRGVVAGCFLFELIGWAIRAHLQGHPMPVLAMGALALVVIFGWTLLCVRWLGWPRPLGRQEVRPNDVLRFAIIGLLVFPLGYAAINVVRLGTTYGSSMDELVSVAIQVYFAKQFGVAVITLPVVVGWTERLRPAPVAAQRVTLAVSLLFVLLLSVWLSELVRTGLDASRMMVMDSRIVLIAVVGWSMLNLRMSVATALFALAMFLMVKGLASAAVQSGSLVGVLNLTHLSLELAILLTGTFYYTLSARDRARLQLQVFEDARRDSITGLPNYTALLDQPEARVGAKREIGYLLLDQADDLAVGFGLQAQTRVMTAVAARLAASMRAYYLGTGQFALLPDEHPAPRLAWQGLLSGIERMEHAVGGRQVRITPYLGVVNDGSGSDGIEQDLLGASNLAYEARRRNEVRPLFADALDASLWQEHQGRLHDTADAIAGLRMGRLLLYFQEIHPLCGQAEDGVRGEVLCRMLDRTGRMLPASRFVHAIEASRRGAELDLAVVRALFSQLRANPRAIPHCSSLSINLTGQSLSSAGFRAELEALLAATPIPLSRLCFEITETAAISSTEDAGLLLASLRERGCRIAIDDFGTGMQSFARLRDLPFDVIKVDGSFVRNMLKDPRDHEVVQASVAVARACGADVVAEFVEDVVTADRLRAMGVQWAQGYLYAQPRPLSELLRDAASKAPGHGGMPQSETMRAQRERL